MSQDHTPGPWRLGKSYGAVVANSTIGTHWDLCNVAAYGGALVCESIRTEANARLIAAAPEMLEALENLENDDGSIPAHAWALVQAAIAKARGAAA